jgi:hypothetical protein
MKSVIENRPSIPPLFVVELGHQTLPHEPSNMKA